MKIKKIRNIIMIIIFILSVSISTLVNADFKVFHDGVIVGEANGHHFKPHEINGEGKFYCIWYGAAYDPTIENEGEYSNYSVGDTIPETLPESDNECISAVTKPWDDNAKSYLQYKRERQIVDIEHQDVAYILANLPEDEMEAAKAIWDSSISYNVVEFNTSLSLESKAYSVFYNSIHDASGQDIYSSLINYDYSRVKVAVNQDDDTYVVGPFTVNYPQGSYNDKKFSWISGITAIDQDDATLPELQILSENGSLVYDTDGDGNSLNVPRNGEDFYIKFKSTTAMSVKLKVDFGYIESCSAEMYEYSGTRIYRNWKKVERTCYNHGEMIDGNWYPGTRTEYYYKLAEEEGDTTQPLMAHVGTATMNKKDTSIIIAPDGIDLTMNLEGEVFLDKDTGKTNTGNNQIDEGELLPGVEVRLYDATVGGNHIRIALTDENGKYAFTRLNSQHKYYVRFTYNGMLYTNVVYNRNGENTSKATEEGQGHNNNRQEFNNKFAEIGSYPSNYKTKDCITGADIYNKTYLQEDIASLFKQVSEEVVRNGGDEKAAYQTVINNNPTVAEIREKVQYVADCRINAYTVDQYPLIPIFTTYYGWAYIAGANYEPIYLGTYTQLHVNLGIKARTTFDMALYKDVSKAVVSINGKTETYNYGLLDEPAIGVLESDYLEGMRQAYIRNDNSYANANKEKATRNIDTDSYNLYTRKEETTNGGSFIDNNDVVTKYELQGTDRLNIEVTYKIEIVNQSSTIGAITEIVDYYDNNYEFASAYVGDENGNVKGQVVTDETSRYRNAQFTSNKNSYKTIYLRPDQETRLDNNEKQYIYVTFRVNGQNLAGDLLEKVLQKDTDVLLTMNLAEINGYKTYSSETESTTPGLVDIDSNPGNLNISNIDNLTDEAIMAYPGIRSMYEDDTHRAPAMIFSLYDARTISGTVFEDNTGWNDETIHTGQERKGNGQLDDVDTKINGIIVELVEVKNGKLITRAKTTTDNGNYKFTGFLPGNYTVRYTYGSDDATAMNETSTWYKGLNSKSYNGQEYQSTIFNFKPEHNTNNVEYTTDQTLISRYEKNRDEKNKENKEEATVGIKDKTTISKYYDEGYYWYTINDNLSDASDDTYREEQVKDYAKKEYTKEITNHKAEVFNAYVNPQPDHITQEQNRTLANELERRTNRYAYTPEIEVEVEYATETISGTQANQEYYKHDIIGVDFGIVERPRSELVIDQKVERIKVLAADGITVLFDTTGPTSNLQWIEGQTIGAGTKHYKGGAINGYKKQELVNIIMDEELISGAKLEVTYKFTVTNNSEKDGDSTTRAKTIVNYVANNLNFDANDSRNKNWKVVKANEIQTEANSTYINNKVVDLSTQAVILQTKDTNNLTKALNPGEQKSETLVLTKVLSAESTLDDLTYTNLAEIVEIDNTVGRYDHGATPGNQSIEKNPQEHDSAGASKYDTISDGGNTPDNPPDGVIIITPPTGSTYIYYVIGIASAVILAAGVYLIKKFVIDRK